MAKFKKKCSRCKKNYIKVSSLKYNYVLCYDCQKTELKGEITDPKMKKLLNVPEEYYKDSVFLRSIKINYLRYQRLTDKQIEAFEKAVEKLKEEL